jgi:hypothetical protein
MMGLGMGAPVTTTMMAGMFIFAITEPNAFPFGGNMLRRIVYGCASFVATVMVTLGAFCEFHVAAAVFYPPMVFVAALLGCCSVIACVMFNAIGRLQQQQDRESIAAFD